MKKKLWLALAVAWSILSGAAVLEYLFYHQAENLWLRHFEEHLHWAEARADDLLATFQDSVDADLEEWEEDVVFLGFREGQIVFWTNGQLGQAGLYEQLNQGNHFVKIGNAYYEVRHRRSEDMDYFALLRIKYSYPYTNKYIKDGYGKFLRISEDNTDQIKLFTSSVEKGHVITTREGKELFHVVFGPHYKERVPSYLLFTLYLLFFLSLFYIYGLVLKNTSSWKSQLLYLFVFILFLCGLRYFMQTFRLPPSVYRLPIFNETLSKDIFISSLGDFLLTAFCVFQVMYVTLSNIKINYENPVLRRYRYVMAAVLFLFVFFYINFFNFSIDLVVENMDIHLNIAQLVNVGISSLVAFIAIILSGLVIVLILYGMVSVFQHFFSFGSMVLFATCVCLFLWPMGHWLRLYTHFWDCFFIWVIILLVAVNKYLVKKDIQRSIYILVIFLLSVYIVMVTKSYEQFKEQRQRMNYATELIEERDYNFEKRLLELDEVIAQSDELRHLLDGHHDVAADSLLGKSMLDMTGYNYYPNITFCRDRDSLWLSDIGELWECRNYFEELIQKSGYELEGTHFYSIGVFDGFVTYIGRFCFGDTYLYLRFDAPKDDEGLGYPQLLSRKSADENNHVYHYSYAKYSGGELVSSSGNFVYHKKLDALVKGNPEKVEIIEKAGYSHMLIPVDREGTLVISLHGSTFSLYYMNALYAFFICILISSYGLFFNVNRDINFLRGTLKARIKNRVISLICVLFVLLTALSIYTNTKSFESRHNAKAIDLLKYVNKELERLKCVDWEECPDILETLSDMSELLLVDINVYAESGRLVATSRPEIFQHGFQGDLINPKALKQIRSLNTASYIESESIAELEYLSVYMPLMLDNGKTYILNIPYFAQNDELNLDIIIMVVITVNIAIVMMVLAFILSGVVAERVTKPLQMLNDKLKMMRIGGKNEKITYHQKDEVGMLVREYNNMVDKLEESIEQLARSERENAWREMARQIAHEIKNPLTPMKLNIQFMLRSLQMEDNERFKQRFQEVSKMLMEQIDNMAHIASAFSDFAKLSVARAEVLRLDELVKNCILLFRNSVSTLTCEVEEGSLVYADKEQMRRVLINLLKNAEQSIPDGRAGEIRVTVKVFDRKVEIRVKDNGVGIPEELRKKIFEPNFTTKSSGTGLGLAISRSIVESFGGSIGFRTELEKGTEFFVVLDRYRNE